MLLVPRGVLFVLPGRRPGIPQGSVYRVKAPTKHSALASLGTPAEGLTRPDRRQCAVGYRANELRASWRLAGHQGNSWQRMCSRWRSCRNFLKFRPQETSNLAKRRRSMDSEIGTGLWIASCLELHIQQGSCEHPHVTEEDFASATSAPPTASTSHISDLRQR